MRGIVHAGLAASAAISLGVLAGAAMPTQMRASSPSSLLAGNHTDTPVADSFVSDTDQNNPGYASYPAWLSNGATGGSASNLRNPISYDEAEDGKAQAATISDADTSDDVTDVNDQISATAEEADRAADDVRAAEQGRRTQPEDQPAKVTIN